MKRLENKTAIVTGGNSGIGKATAILFAKEGADLVLCARRKEALDEVAEECRKYGVQVVTVKADVSSHEDCSAVVKAAVDTFGKVDILVNNAGIVDKHRPITECTDEWRPAKARSSMFLPSAVCSATVVFLIQQQNQRHWL